MYLYLSIIFRMLRQLFRRLEDLFINIIIVVLNIGAIDVVGVEQEDGSFKMSPFEVSFGILSIIFPNGQLIDIEINDKKVDDLHMEFDTSLKTYKLCGMDLTTKISSDKIKKLNLGSGMNKIKYTVTTALQGTTQICSNIFLWRYDDKIIVSDIDGTITRSDVWGHVLPPLGIDWTQPGIADLFTAIEKNEYKFVYLSARAIGQSQTTRDLLMNVKQNTFSLPQGPLLITPFSLFEAFRKEVIERKPEVYKIEFLNKIKSLFPQSYNPFYAGFGNRTNDVTAYKAVGIDQSRIFTVNSDGKLKHENSISFNSSYSELRNCVNVIFEPIKKSKRIFNFNFLHLVTTFVEMIKNILNYCKDTHTTGATDDVIEQQVNN